MDGYTPLNFTIFWLVFFVLLIGFSKGLAWLLDWDARRAWLKQRTQPHERVDLYDRTGRG
jgi:hypothetical protein